MREHAVTRTRRKTSWVVRWQALTRFVISGPGQTGETGHVHEAKAERAWQPKLPNRLEPTSGGACEVKTDVRVRIGSR